jgi:hypothetical protein
VLKPSGVRIVTAEIYNQVEEMEEVADSLAIGQTWQGDQGILLFVKCAEGYDLTDDLKNKIKVTLRTKASPRHIPAEIIEVPDIPYTQNTAEPGVRYLKAGIICDSVAVFSAILQCTNLKTVTTLLSQNEKDPL